MNTVLGLIRTEFQKDSPNNGIIFLLWLMLLADLILAGFGTRFCYSPLKNGYQAAINNSGIYAIGYSLKGMLVITIAFELPPWVGLVFCILGLPPRAFLLSRYPFHHMKLLLIYQWTTSLHQMLTFALIIQFIGSNTAFALYSCAIYFILLIKLGYSHIS
jgi:hypothetical protein